MKEIRTENERLSQIIIGLTKNQNDTKSVAFSFLLYFARVQCGTVHFPPLLFSFTRRSLVLFRVFFAKT